MKAGIFMKNEHYLHGGDLDAAARTYHLDRASIWDFSGNINPLGISQKAKDAICNNLDMISTYPDRTYTSLRQTLSTYCHAPVDHIMVGSGSTELISLVISILKPKKALALGPTYSEYEREISLVGGSLTYFSLKEEDDFKLNLPSLLTALKENHDLLILCNPNNPTSTALTTETLEEIIAFCKAHHIFVMVDETYIEFCDCIEHFCAIPLTMHYDNLFVLRGISKFFSAPGLRFGYGICSHLDLIRQLKHLQNPWSVTILATLAAEEMFKDRAYIDTTHQLFVEERKRMLKELLTWDKLHVFIPQANFILLKVLNPDLTGAFIQDTLVKQSMLIRDASSFPYLTDKHIRFCFLRPEQNTKLLESLHLILYGI